MVVLFLPVLAVDVWSGSIVASISLGGRAQRRPNNRYPVAKKKSSEEVDDSNYVYASLKSSDFGGSASVAVIKV